MYLWLLLVELNGCYNFNTFDSITTYNRLTCYPDTPPTDTFPPPSSVWPPGPPLCSWGHGEATDKRDDYEHGNTLEAAAAAGVYGQRMNGQKSLDQNWKRGQTTTERSQPGRFATAPTREQADRCSAGPGWRRNSRAKPERDPRPERRPSPERDPGQTHSEHKESVRLMLNVSFNSGCACSVGVTPLLTPWEHALTSLVKRT